MTATTAGASGTRPAHGARREPDRPGGRAGLRVRGRRAGARWADARREHADRHPHPHPAGDAQPARPGRRRDRHRQDQDPAADGRAAEHGRRARSSPPTSRATSPAWPPRACRSDKLSERARRRSASSGARPASRSSTTRSAARAPASRCGSRCRRSARPCSSKVLGLNDTQESSLGLVFHYADQAGLPLLDLADLREVVKYLTSDEGKADLKDLGGLSSATAGVILRELIGFSDQGADAFFGEPEFESADLLQTTADGRGLISLVELPNLQDRPAVFSTFLMWLLADLFHDLPEVGDVDQPKLVFFFDEAHLLFNDASQGVPRPDRPDRAADPVQGRRRLLRDPEPDRRARRRARPARLAGPAPAPRAHAQRRQGAQGDREHLPQLGLRRPRPGDHRPRHRRGGRHRDERARRARPRWPGPGCARPSR